MVSVENDADLLVTFGMETINRLHEVDSLLLKLKEGSTSFESSINQIFRDAHSIKSGANLLKLSKIEQLAHAVEDVLHVLRERKIIPDKQSIKIIIEATDFIRQLIYMIKLSNHADIESIVKRLNGLAVSLQNQRN
ncbi:MAG: Hpt domain-containing protein [Nitrospirae bacterium]|nr:Hpt domain-containing protein [Nitrospirota bacterium]MBF0536491.1 Hpt domain-containing protein [Nitrospirota bacterium]MBF0617859.1 Hpt domain-containing protein [Nitrospirota bacterium]